MTKQEPVRPLRASRLLKLGLGMFWRRPVSLLSLLESDPPVVASCRLDTRSLKPLGRHVQLTRGSLQFKGSDSQSAKGSGASPNGIAPRLLMALQGDEMR